MAYLFSDGCISEIFRDHDSLLQELEVAGLVETGSIGYVIRFVLTNAARFDGPIVAARHQRQSLTFSQNIMFLQMST